MQEDDDLVSKVTTILEVLSDGEWHEVEELKQLTDLSENKVREIAAFLYKYDFVKMDAKNSKVRIRECIQEFLAQQ